MDHVAIVHHFFSETRPRREFTVVFPTLVTHAHVELANDIEAILDLDPYLVEHHILFPCSQGSSKGLSNATKCMPHA